MRTVEFVAPSGENEDQVHNMQSADEIDFKEIEKFSTDMSKLNQADLKTTKTDLTLYLGEIEGEISEDPEKIWNEVLIQLSGIIRARIFIVSNFIEGNTQPS